MQVMMRLNHGVRLWRLVGTWKRLTAPSLEQMSLELHVPNSATNFLGPTTQMTLVYMYINTRVSSLHLFHVNDVPLFPSPSFPFHFDPFSIRGVALSSCVELNYDSVNVAFPRGSSTRSLLQFKGSKSLRMNVNCHCRTCS
jgi:hypothetical protein